MNKFSSHYDLITPDGKISAILSKDETKLLTLVEIRGISQYFHGYQIDTNRVLFNSKSTLAQLGVHAILKDLKLNKKLKSATLQVEFIAIGSFGIETLKHLEIGAYVGKLFAADDRRIVRDPDYLLRYFGRSDLEGRPLLTLGGLHGSDDLILEKNDGRTVAYLTLKKGAVTYDDTVLGLIPVLCKALKENTVKSRQLIHLSQKIIADSPRTLKNNDLLLVKTTPLHMRTVFGHVVDELLPSGFSHMSASILQPDTEASGDIYELFGESSLEIHAIPLEFYTLEPFREHVFFSDRDQLQNCIEEKKALFDAFATAPSPIHHKCATFVVKGDQLLSLSEDDWTKQESIQSEYPGIFYPSRQAKMVDKYIKQQPSYPFFDAIEKGTITSEGILLTRYFPSPVMKRHLLSNKIFQHLKGIYFEYPSRSFGDFFSKEDHSLLLDLAQFGIPVFWLDKKTEKILQYVPKSGKDSGMFVPLHEVDRFSNATLFGLYGSNLKEGPFVKLLHDLLKGVLELKSQMNHPLLNPLKPLAMVTGGGPGVMELGNRIARELNYLSCANIVDFSNKTSFVNEQTQNPYIDAKMTYRIDHLVERQSEFHLDFPIFLMGGIGTDFEYALEEVRRKVGSTPPSPILLIGNKSYWEEKISSRFDNNMQNGTTAGSEWISNNFYVIETAKQGLEVYKAFFRNTLPIGKDGPVYPLGFKLMEDSDSWPQSEEK